MAVADNQVHDWLILLDREIEHIWRRNWSVGKALFIITRYGPFLDMPLTVAGGSNPFIVGIGGSAESDSTVAVHDAPYGAMDGNVSKAIASSAAG